MQVTAPIYEKPSQLSQGLVVGLSIAVVLMAGWLATTIMFSDDMTTAAEGNTDATASMPVPAPVSAADKLPANAGVSPTEAAASSSAPAPTARSVQFDWPAEFDAKPAPPAQTALPFAPTDVPATHDARNAAWPPATTVPDNARAFAARQPPPQGRVATSTSATDAIVDLLSPPPPSGVGPSTRTVPARR